MDYNGYLQSPQWAELRKFKLQQTGYRCQGCGGDERLEVHHLSYAKLGNERSEELMVLCHLCHVREHGRAPTRMMPIAGVSLDEISDSKQDEYAVFARARRVGQLDGIQRDLQILQGRFSGRARRRVKTCLYELECFRREERLL